MPINKTVLTINVGCFAISWVLLCTGYIDTCAVCIVETSEKLFIESDWELRKMCNIEEFCFIINNNPERISNRNMSDIIYYIFKYVTKNGERSLRLSPTLNLTTIST